MSVVFQARGHRNIQCTHPTTIEFTRDKTVTSKGDCIAGVDSNMAAKDMPLEVKRNLESPNGRAELILEIPGHQFAIHGNGATGLTFSDYRDLVIRKSNYLSGRTLMVNADRSAQDIPRSMVNLLQNPSTIIMLKLNTFTDSSS